MVQLTSAMAMCEHLCSGLIIAVTKSLEIIEVIKKKPGEAKSCDFFSFLNKPVKMIHNRMECRVWKT